jgi:2-polyprenyl-6-methoxyphenol hydroxylase-like FAD-dependent oxidoreductase
MIGSNGQGRRSQNTGRGRRALVIGGSLGGLFAAVLLAQDGWIVDVYERSPRDLDSRGGGLVLQPQVLQVFQRAGVRYDASIGVEAKERVFLAPDGSVAHRIPMRQMLTSWTSIYAALRRRFPEAHYHQGRQLVGLSQDEAGVTARFADGAAETGDLLVAADGGGSTVRRLLLPEVEPEYAGYVAWRGLVDEPDLAPDAAAVLAERFAFFEYPNSHILDYLVPGEGDAVEPGRRRYNWVWYRNVAEGRLPELLADRDGRVRASSVPPGLLSPAAEADVRAAAERFLPPPFRTLVAATAEPFIQTIVDLAVPRMAFGRVALVGDAAFVPRPHTAASTSKAAGNALSLADAFVHHADVADALRAWEGGELGVGQYLRSQGQALGSRSQRAYPADTPT